MYYESDTTFDHRNVIITFVVITHKQLIYIVIQLCKYMLSVALKNEC